MAAYYGVGCNYAISSGNEADLNLLDWVADLLERPEVEIIVAFMVLLPSRMPIRPADLRTIGSPRQRC